VTDGRVAAALGAWLAVALAAGASGLVARLRPPLPQAVLLVLTLGLLALYRGSAAWRAWADGVDIRALVLLHLTRFVGIYFLVLYGRGQLPWAFAVPGGWGDIAVAVLAGLVVAWAPTRGRGGWAAYAGWNVAGLVDILLVVATAARQALGDPASMRALTVLPLGLLPTFLVPLIIASHVVIWVRLRASRRAGYRPF
jgi:hypothetical protein